jgi:Protein of unknown function (DUF402)
VFSPIGGRPLTRGARSWRQGDVIVRREVWRGRPYAGIPVIVVSDEPGLLAAYIPEEAPFAFPESDWPGGPHPWSVFGSWQGHGVLMLHRPDDAYAVFVFWEGEDRAFSRWYLNLQAPLRRTSIGFDTLDHVLDLWSPDGRLWHWKDVEQLEQRVSEGHFTPDEALAIAAEGKRLEAELLEHGPWWDETWARWAPDPAWPVPTLPEGWELRSS